MESEVFVWLVRMAEILLISFTLGRLLCCWSKKKGCDFDSNKRLACVDWYFFFPLFSFTLLFTIFWFLFSCPLTLAPSLFLFNACLCIRNGMRYLAVSKNVTSLSLPMNFFVCCCCSFFRWPRFWRWLLLPISHFLNRIKNSTNLYRFAILTNFNVDNNRVTARLLSVPAFCIFFSLLCLCSRNSNDKENSYLNSNLNMNQMNCNIYYSTPISSLGKITCLIIWQHQLNYRHWCSLMSSNVWPFVQTFSLHGDSFFSLFFILLFFAVFFYWLPVFIRISFYNHPFVVSLSIERAIYFDSLFKW